MDQYEFGQRVAWLRKERLLSQNMLGVMTCMDPTTITRIELGRQNVSLSQAYAIAEALGTTLPKLLEQGDPPRRQRIPHPVMQKCPFCPANVALAGVITIGNYQQSGGVRQTSIRLKSEVTIHECPGPSPLIGRGFDTNEGKSDG